MQVFVPLSSSLRDSARCLDRSRAGNQCWRESKTLWGGGWASHPAHQLFGTNLGPQHPDAYHGAFAEYNAHLIEWVYEKSWCSPRTYHKWHRYWSILAASAPIRGLPPWWGDERVHSSHRACLLAKDLEWYRGMGFTERPTPKSPITDKWPYVWPEELT